MTPEEMRLIGGSDVPALLGLSKYRNAFDVFARIKEGKETPDNKILRRGRLMEPVIRQMAVEDLGLTLLGPRKLKDPKRPYVRASLDDVNAGASGEEVMEFKSVSSYARDDYGDAGTDMVPESHLAQSQFYVRRLGAPRARLVALIGLDDLREFILESDAEFQDICDAAVDRFHTDHVLTGKPPAIDGSTSCEAWLKERFRSHSKEMLQATPEGEAWAKRYHAARLAREEAGKMEKEARNNLINLIGSSEGLVGDGWRVSFGEQKGKVGVDVAALKAAGLYDKYTKRGTAYRVFRPKFDGVEESQDE